jgi:hypothetical protein
MPAQFVLSAENLTSYFTRYVFAHYADRRHVRRVLPWLGFVVMAILRLNDGRVRFNRERQLLFDSKGRTYKARFSHTIGSRGGIELLEVLPGRGMPDGKTLAQVTCLKDAERLYLGVR